jgi:hypothetical protein
MIAWISRRTPSARAGFPRARSSMTRSSRLETNVTPLALTACRSQGASSHGFDGSRYPSELLATTSSIGPRGGAVWIDARRSAGLATFRRWLTVGYDRVRSTAWLPRTAMTDGPSSAGTHARPISKASALSLGTHSRADRLSRDVMVLSSWSAEPRGSSPCAAPAGKVSPVAQAASPGFRAASGVPSRHGSTTS